jgi:hypothetical protein
VTAPAATLAQGGSDRAPAGTTRPPSPFAIAPEPGDNPGSTARGYFVYELAAGDEARGSIQVENPGQAATTIELTAVDARTAQTGGSAFAGSDEAPSAAGSWLRLDVRHVSLAPGQRQSVGFSVHLPEATEPGQYLAGIAAFVPVRPNDAPRAGEDQVAAAVSVQTRAVIGVQIDVPGEWTPALTIAGARMLAYPSGTRLGIALRNDGDTFLTAAGSVTLSNAAGIPILTRPIVLGTFLPGTDVTYPIPWAAEPLAGAYGVDVELNYTGDKVARYRGALTVGNPAPAAPRTTEEEVHPAAPVPAPEAPPNQPWPPYVIAGLVGLMALSGITLGIRARQPH